MNRGAGAGGLGLGCTVAVAFLAGHSQTFLFLGYATAAWAVVLVAGARCATVNGRKATLLRVLLGLAVAGAIAVGLSAAQLLPSLEFAGLSVRANVDYAFVSGGFPLQDTWQALLPGVLTQYSPLYIGVVGLGLAWLGGLVRGARSVCNVRSGCALEAFAACGCRLFPGTHIDGLAAFLRRQRVALSACSIGGRRAGICSAGRSVRLTWWPLA